MDLETEAKRLAASGLDRAEAVRRLVEFAEGELGAEDASRRIDRWRTLQQPGVDAAYEQYLDDVAADEDLAEAIRLLLQTAARR